MHTKCINLSSCLVRISIQNHGRTFKRALNLLLMSSSLVQSTWDKIWQKKKRKVLSWVKWNKDTLFTSIHFSYPSNLDLNQRCFKSSRDPSSGRRVPASQDSQSLFLVVVNEFLKRRSTCSFLSFLFLSIVAVRVWITFQFSAYIFFSMHFWSSFCKHDDNPWQMQMFSVIHASS